VVVALEVQLYADLYALLQLGKHSLLQLYQFIMGLSVVLVDLDVLPKIVRCVPNYPEVNLNGDSGISSPATLDQQEGPGIQYLVLPANLNRLIQGEHMLSDLLQYYLFLPVDRQQLQVPGLLPVQEFPIIIMN